jgi:hypothetical protein
MSSRGLPATFAAACRRADREQRRKRVDPALERLHRLLEPGVTLERAWHETNHPWRAEGRAAARTVEALMFSLRDGLDAMKDRSNQRRLGELSDKQIQEVAARVQKFMPHVAAAWKPADVQALLSLWSKLR